MNLLHDLPGLAGAEVFEHIARLPGGARIERIVSHGQASPPGFWYDQPWDEWVLVLAGHAVLRIEDEPGERILLPGEHVYLAAGRRHRVEATATGEPTVWLAVHGPAPPGN